MKKIVLNKIPDTPQDAYKLLSNLAVKYHTSLTEACIENKLNPSRIAHWKNAKRLDVNHYIILRDWIISNGRPR